MSGAAPAALTVRPATHDDEQAVLDLIAALFEPPGARPADYSDERARAGFRFCVESATADALVAEVEGRVVGLASVYVDVPSIRFGLRCWLEDLVVTASRRGAGVGGALLEAAKRWARERGCTHLELDSGSDRNDAHRFYLAQGMRQLSLTFEVALD